MDILWDCPHELCTRDVLTRTSRHLAYTTVATVLGNLVRKGVVERVAVRRTWAYRPLLTRSEYVAALMTAALTTSPDRPAALLHFVETMPEEDLAILRGLVGDEGPREERA